MKKITVLSIFFFLSVVTAAFASSSSETPPVEEAPDRFFMELVNMAVSLTLIVAVLLIISWFVKRLLKTRMQQMNTQSGIKILERRPLTAKTAVYILDVHGKGIVLAESANGVVALGNVPLPEEASASTQDALLDTTIGVQL